MSLWYPEMVSVSLLVFDLSKKKMSRVVKL